MMNLLQDFDIIGYEIFLFLLIITEMEHGIQYSLIDAGH